MGWFFKSGCSRRDLIAERTQDWERTSPEGVLVKTTCLAHCYRGGVFSGVLWTVWGRSFSRDSAEVQPNERWIGCDLLRIQKGFGWGYKDMDEAMGLYFYSCPQKYLGLVPIEKFGGHAEWRATVRRYHQRQHAANERRFARAVAKFFREQGQRLIHALAGVGNVVHRHDIDAALNWEAEHERFIRTVGRPQLLVCATSAALMALQTFRAGKSFAPTTKAVDDDDEETVEGELPEEMRAAVRHTVEETLRQPYWRRIQGETRDIIQEAIDNSIDNQFMDERRLGKLISTATDGEISRSRAQRIARTETTGGMNGGHNAVIEGMAREGIKLSKEWLAVEDNDTRADHREANGQVVGPGEMFDVGGEEAPYPGHWSLSAEERINCRCTILAVTDEDY